MIIGLVRIKNNCVNKKFHLFTNLPLLFIKKLRVLMTNFYVPLCLKYTGTILKYHLWNEQIKLLIFKG
jgi:hypothetical protein